MMSKTAISDANATYVYTAERQMFDVESYHIIG
jgi:hypothetical protein